MLYLLSRGSVQPYSNILHEEKKSLFQGKYFYTELIVGKEMFVGLKTKTKHKLLPKGVEVSPRTFLDLYFYRSTYPTKSSRIPHTQYRALNKFLMSQYIDRPTP